MKISSLILSSVFVAGLAMPALAETKVDGQVPFEFTVGSTQLPAGHYKISSSVSDEGILTIENMDTGKRIVVEYITRIGSRGNKESVFVFDVLGTQHILSEIHLVNSDGYLLEGAAKKPHTHKQIKAS